MKHKAKIWIACSVLAVLCFSSFFVFAHAVEQGKLGQVAVGMSRDQVESILGAPQHIRRESAGGIAFCYGGFRRLRWCSVEIRLGADGRVEGRGFHDH